MATILVVDDSPVSRRLLGYTLERGGYTVITADHGGQALERLGETPVDLVIADLAMPEVDGLTLLRQLRADRRYHDLPLVMLTASGQDQDRLTAQAAGANDFLTKPASSRELIETVSRWVG
jgi:two-component system, chemotaxis family, chemotaxis protein CheY